MIHQILEKNYSEKLKEPLKFCFELAEQNLLIYDSENSIKSDFFDISFSNGLLVDYIDFDPYNDKITFHHWDDDVCRFIALSFEEFLELIPLKLKKAFLFNLDLFEK